VQELVSALWRDRGRLGPQVEIEGLGRAAFALVACGRPYTYAGPRAITLVRGGSALELAAPERITPVTLPSLVWGLLRGGLGGRAGVVSGSGLDRLDVLCDRPLPLQVDGEDLGDVEAAAFEVARGALTVFA
jgi:hypothetical protein